jgi:hypothetical protein
MPDEHASKARTRQSPDFFPASSPSELRVNKYSPDFILAGCKYSPHPKSRRVDTRVLPE